MHAAVRCAGRSLDRVPNGSGTLVSGLLRCAASMSLFGTLSGTYSMVERNQPGLHLVVGEHAEGVTHHGGAGDFTERTDMRQAGRVITYLKITSSFDRAFSRATILRASSNGHATARRARARGAQYAVQRWTSIQGTTTGRADTMRPMPGASNGTATGIRTG